jgi:hypothetical protein
MFRNPKVHSFGMPLPVRLEAALPGVAFRPEVWYTTIFTIKLSFCLIKHCAVKTYGALDGGERSASRHCRSTPGEKAPGTSLIKGCVGPRARLMAEDTNLLCPLRIESQFLSFSVLLRSPSLCQLSYPGSFSCVCVCVCVFFPIVYATGNTLRYMLASIYDGRDF